MHAYSILMFLSWPAVILLSWFVIRFALDRYEKKEAKRESPDFEHNSGHFD